MLVPAHQRERVPSLEGVYPKICESVPITATLRP